jgi:hypothetical protein
MVQVERTQLGLRRLGQLCETTRDAVHLLDESTSHQLIIAVEAARNCLAVENLISYPLADETSQFNVGRRSLPASRPLVGEDLDAFCADSDLSLPVDFVWGGI